MSDLSVLFYWQLIRSFLIEIENIFRCGHAESKNDCKSMEDFVFLSPTFNNSGSTTEQVKK